VPRFAFIPFGAGPRTCIGNTFALTEMAIVLATLAQRFSLALEPGHEVAPAPYVTLRPKSGVRVRATRRRAPPAPGAAR
jgi:cytochrome P450